MYSILAVDMPSCNKYSLSVWIMRQIRRGSVDKRARRHPTEPDRAIRRLASSTCYRSHHQRPAEKVRKLSTAQRVKLPNNPAWTEPCSGIWAEWHGKPPPDPDWYEEVGRLRVAKIDNNLMILSLRIMHLPLAVRWCAKTRFIFAFAEKSSGMIRLAADLEWHQLRDVTAYHVELHLLGGNQ